MATVLNKLIQIGSEKGIITLILRGVIRIGDIILDYIYKFQKIDENLIVFYSYPDYSDNSRVLFEHMIHEGYNEKYILVWVVENPELYKKYKEKNVLFIKRYSLTAIIRRYGAYHRRAHWIFSTHGTPFPKKTKPSQIMINLHHGGMGFKTNKGGDKQSLDDYILVSGESNICRLVAKKFHSCTDEQILAVGLPRNDLLFKYRNIQFLDACTGMKILWMPTFRNTTAKHFEDDTLGFSETGLPILYTLNDLKEMNQRLSSLNIHLFIKVHPMQDLSKIKVGRMSNIHTITNSDLTENDIQLYEILNHFNALITDYSSVSFDYLVLNRPIGYTLDDYDDYNRSREFPMDNPLDYMPGHHMYTKQDLLNFISDVSNNRDEYNDERKFVRKITGILDSGNNCEKLLDYLNIRK